MILRKIFQGYASFSLVAAAFFIVYNAAAFVYDPSRGTNFEITGPPVLPRLAYELGFGIPAFAAAWFWKERRPAALGAIAFGVLAWAYWLMTGGFE